MEYLKSATRQFAYYKQLGEQSMAQIEESQLFFQPNEQTNSIAIIVQHLWGNMLSRWTDFRNSDGEKEWRKRDEEFEPVITTKSQLIEHWEKGWICLFEALNSITDMDLQEIIYIRNEGHSILEAINRQIAHYSYHVGQIVFLAKMLKSDEWLSLSIPKNGSGSYNASKFNQEKSNRHFTEEWLTSAQKGKE